MREMLYADELVLTGERRQEVEEMFARWKEAMEMRGLIVNAEKAKLIVSTTCLAIQ